MGATLFKEMDSHPMVVVMDLHAAWHSETAMVPPACSAEAQGPSYLANVVVIPVE